MTNCVATPYRLNGKSVHSELLILVNQSLANTPMEINPAGLPEFYNAAVELGMYSSSGRLSFYLEHHLFKDVPLKDKRVIDIGGGSGLFGFYAAMMGARQVVVMEPEFDGSSAGMNADFQAMKQRLGNPGNIELVTDVLEKYDIGNQQFDVVMLHNSINHIDEEGCINLLRSAAAQQTYSEFFDLLTSISSGHADLIICDCTNRNFFQKIGIANPIMRTIEWQKHQPPEVWAEFAEKVGFKKVSVRWTTINALGRLGQLVFGNRVMAYFTLSHFRLHMQKRSTDV